MTNQENMSIPAFAHRDKIIIQSSDDGEYYIAPVKEENGQPYTQHGISKHQVEILNRDCVTFTCDLNSDCNKEELIRYKSWLESFFIFKSTYEVIKKYVEHWEPIIKPQVDERKAQLNLLDSIVWTSKNGCISGQVDDSPEWTLLLGDENYGTYEWTSSPETGEVEYIVNWYRKWEIPNDDESEDSKPKDIITFQPIYLVRVEPI